MGIDSYMVYSTRLCLPVSQVSASFLFEYTKDFLWHWCEIQHLARLFKLNLLTFWHGPSSSLLLCTLFTLSLPFTSLLWVCVLGEPYQKQSLPNSKCLNLVFSTDFCCYEPLGPTMAYVSCACFVITISFSPLNSLQSNSVSLSNAPFLSLNNFLDLPCFFTWKNRSDVHILNTSCEIFGHKLTVPGGGSLVAS